MSRILRRPMFRGGRVSSYGTGIAAPLVPGYQGGGQIGGGIIYGKPMADGRYGFDKPQIVGGDLLFKEPALNQKQWEEQQKWKNWEPEFKDQDSIQSAYEQAIENEKKLLDSLLIEGPLTPDKDHYADLDFLQSEEGKKKFFQDTKTEQDEKIKKAKAAGVDVTTELNQQVDTPKVDADTQKLLDRIKYLEGLQSTEEPEVDAKTAVAENKELFRDLLGYDKAKGQDISDMLLGFAGAEGDDTWSKAKSFFRDEAKRPGKAQKISDAAGTLAIQDYIAGKKSADAIKLMRATEDYRPTAKLKAMLPKDTDSLNASLMKFAEMNGTKNVNSERTIKDALENKTKKPVVRNTKIKLDDVENPNKQKNLQLGINIIEKDNKKYYVEWDGTTVDIHQTLEEVWAKY